MNTLDFAILHGFYNCALEIYKSTKIEIKDHNLYKKYALKKDIVYLDYKIITDHLKSEIIPENVPIFTERPSLYYIMFFYLIKIYY